jgi:hypothetical protein
VVLFLLAPYCGRMNGVICRMARMRHLLWSQKGVLIVEANLGVGLRSDEVGMS